MAGKSLALWVVIPFVLLSAVALWLTRGGQAAPRGAPGPVPSARQPPAPSPLPTQVGVSEPRAAAAQAATPPAAAEAPDAQDEAALEAGDGGAPGTVDPDALREAVEAARPLVRQCFLDVTERYPGPQSVRLRFTLEGQGGAGRVRDAEVAETSIQDPFLLACFLDALEDVPFPAPRGGRVTVSFPFRFRAARAGAGAGAADAG